jgi:NHLM bacteriocin system ABC transporter ATP-binding protein
VAVGKTIAIRKRAAEMPDGSASEVLSRAGSTQFRLDSGKGWWLVRSGQVDLFAVALQQGEPAGTRHPLCRISAGELIAALPANSDHTIIAVGPLDTSIIALGRGDTATWPVARQAELIDRWLVLLATALFGDVPAWPEIAGEPGNSLCLPAGKRLYALQGPVWVTPRSSILAAGHSRIEVSGAVPIVAGFSVCAEEDTTADLVSTEKALQNGAVGDGLDRFHTIVLTALAERIAAAEEAGRQRVVARGDADRRGLQWALQRLAEVGGGMLPQASREVPHSPTIAALAAVAAYQGLELPGIPRVITGDPSSFRAVARAYGIGLRQVLLRGIWWRSDNGPLLAWHSQTKCPVALLPTGNRGYWMWHPTDSSSVRVDATVAAEIVPQAFMTYRPLPQQLPGIAALVGFAARGIGSELTTIVAAAALAGIVAALLPVAVGFLFESAVPRAETSQVLVVIIGLTLAALGAGVFDLTKAIALLRLEGRLETAMQPALMSRLLGLPVNFFRAYATGELTNRVLSIQSMRKLLAGNTLVSLLSALFATSSFLVILIYSPLLSIVATALVAAAALISGGLTLGELRQERARIQLRGQEDSLIVQIIQGIAKLRVAASEARIFALWAGLFARQKHRFLTGRRYAGLAEIFVEVYPILTSLALFFTASRFLTPTGNAQPSLGLGGFLAVNAAFGQLFAATMALARASATALELVPLFERLRPIIAAQPESRPDRREAPALSGRIEVSHVSFRYTEGSHLVLDDLSLGIEPGAFVALVGPSGSGKSTLLRLLLGFETPEGGDIFYDGQSMRTLDAASLRRQIGVVLQRSRVLSGSIFDNITGGLPYTLDDAWAAARLAELDGVIEALPMGMHTLLIEGSATLSGGQRQRLMIARALIGKPRVLFFDEATSALDNQSQALLTRSLERLRTTRLVIAHRLSTVEHADRIFVLDRGRLVEYGRFDELIVRDGLFSRLARRQIL